MAGAEYLVAWPIFMVIQHWVKVHKDHNQGFWVDISIE